jgi:hypothetical protein
MPNVMSVHGLSDNGCTFSIPLGRRMSHNRRTLQFVEAGPGRHRFGAPTHATERRSGVRVVATVVPGSSAGMWLMAEDFAVGGERSGRLAPPIFQNASVVAREGSDADGK